MKTAVVILAGGTGTRLWPLSTKKNPKQFVNLVNEKSLLRNTFDRAIQIFDTKDIYVATSTKFYDEILKEIPELKSENIILEPKKMDTAPSIALITFKLNSFGYDTVISLACDHNIEDVDKFLEVLKTGISINQKYPDNLLLIGMNPSFPSTGYGYIEMGEPKDRINGEIVFSVNSFREKPDLKTAEKFVDDWKYLWNSGYFIYNPGFILEQFKKSSPQTYAALKDTYSLDPYSDEFAEAYGACEAISFDYAIIEKLKDILVLPASVGWSDIGSWKTVREILTDNKIKANVFKANVISLDTKGTVVYANNQKKLIAVLGLKDAVIIDTDEVLLVTTIDKSQDVKKMVEMSPDDLK